MIVIINVLSQHTMVPLYQKSPSTYHQCTIHFLCIVEVDMFRVIADILVQWYLMVNAFLVTTNFCNAKKMNCAFMIIIINHYERIVVNSLIQLE